MSSSTGWVERLEVFPSKTDGNKYLLVEQVDVEDDKWYHVVLHDRVTKQATPLTSGKMEVTAILYWDEVNNEV